MLPARVFRTGILHVGLFAQTFLCEHPSSKNLKSGSKILQNFELVRVVVELSKFQALECLYFWIGVHISCHKMEHQLQVVKYYRAPESQEQLKTQNKIKTPIILNT